jgi:hypothetical protein
VAVRVVGARSVGERVGSKSTTELHRASGAPTQRPAEPGDEGGCSARVV